MWYTTKVGPDMQNTENVANVAMVLAVNLSHPGPEHWNAF